MSFLSVPFLFFDDSGSHQVVVTSPLALLRFYEPGWPLTHEKCHELIVVPVMRCSHWRSPSPWGHMGLRLHQGSMAPQLTPCWTSQFGRSTQGLCQVDVARHTHRDVIQARSAGICTNTQLWAHDRTHICPLLVCACEPLTHRWGDVMWHGVVSDLLCN